MRRKSDIYIACNGEMMNKQGVDGWMGVDG